MDQFKEEIKVNIKEMQIMQENAKRIYRNFIEKQQEQFRMFIHYLNQYINTLREQGIISPFLKFYARIKATNSALENSEKKALDDVFGIEFICSTEQEIEILQKRLAQIIKVHKVKKHNKRNGYKAIHHSCSITVDTMKELEEQEEEERFPIIEIQYKTIQVYWEAILGSASHEKYKDTKIPQLQKLYDNGQLKVGEDIPYMWISNADTDNMRELSIKEILKKMYPSLQLNKDTKTEEKGRE